MKLVFKKTGVEQDITIEGTDEGIVLLPVGTRGLYFYSSIAQLGEFWETARAWKEKHSQPESPRRDELEIVAEKLERKLI